MAPEAEELSPEEKLLKVIQEGPKKPEQEAAASGTKPSVKPQVPGRPVSPPTATPATASKAGAAAPEAKPALPKTGAVPAGRQAPDRSVKLGAPKPAVPGGKVAQPQAAGSAPAEKADAPAKQAVAAVPKPVEASAQPAGKQQGPLIGKPLEPAESEQSVIEAAPPRKDGPRSGAAVSLISRFLVLLLLVLTAGLAWEILADKSVFPESPESIVIVDEQHELTKLGPIDPYIVAATSNRIMDELTGEVIHDIPGDVPNDPEDVVASYIAKNLSLDAVGSSAQPDGKAFGVVTDIKTGRSCYLSVGDSVELGLDGAAGPTTVTVSEVREESVVFLYEGAPMVLEARR